VHSGLAEALSSSLSGQLNRENFFAVKDRFLTPGFWIALAARTRAEPDQKIFIRKNLFGYADAIGLGRSIWGADH
jgi:hypothetical protein